MVIGYVETHGRAETRAQAGGLEVVPRRRVSYRGAELEEMDLPAILRRAPELCLIDELAHTNAPGIEHEKRYQDIEDVLDAGTDVFSTVNVQHLESLNDQVCDLTGIRVRETVPDSVLGVADDVVLIDITPDSLIERLTAGKVYPRERVQSALQNFFKIENLSALREVALRQVAEEVEAKRIPSDSGGSRPRQERLIDTAAPQAIGERLLALVQPRPSSQRIVRRAWRSAQRLGAELDLLWVTDHEPEADEQEQLAALRQLASVLGAHLLVEHGDDIAAVTQRVAGERGTTYVLMGAPKPSQPPASTDPARPALPPAGTVAGGRSADRRRPHSAGHRRERDGTTMTGALVVACVLLASALVTLAATHLQYRTSRAKRVAASGPRRILFPFVAHALSSRALDAALRLALAEEATLVPTFLARVTLDLPPDAPLPRQSGLALPLQEAVEQRAASFGVPVDARIHRGRTNRHALRETIDQERFDRIVIAAAAQGESGFHPDDVAWLLDNAPGEIVVLRPSKDEQLGPPVERRRRRRHTRTATPTAQRLAARG